MEKPNPDVLPMDHQGLETMQRPSLNLPEWNHDETHRGGERQSTLEVVDERKRTLSGGNVHQPDGGGLRPASR